MYKKRKKDEELVEGVLIGSGLPCPKCNGSDPMALYEKTHEDGTKTVDGYCYSRCGYLTPEEVDGYDNSESKIEEKYVTDFSNIEALEIRGWRERKIKKSTCEFFGIRTEFNEDGEVVKRYYPVTEDDTVVGYHMRDVKAKEARNRGEKPDSPSFVSIGKNKTKQCQLFGQSLFNSGGKFLVIVGGEEDTAAFYQIMYERKGFKTPCVSATNGEANTAAQVKANYDFVSSFDKVIIMLDNDETGNKAAEEVARLLKPGQAYIARMNEGGCKDVCDYLRDGLQSELIDAFWKAEKYSPTGIYKLSQMWDAFEDQTENEMIPFPPSFGGLNEMMNGGVERGEVTVVGALTSIGKSSLIATIVYHLLDQTPFKVGAMYLEATRREVVRDLLSLHTCTNLRKKKRGEIDMKYLRNKFFEELAEQDNFAFVDHQGALSNEELFQKLRYLAKGEEVDVIVFDPIQAGVNSSDNGAIIEFMDALLKLAKETDVAIIAVSHMRKPDSEDPHAVSEYHLLGCVDKETEFLSQDGWKKISEYEKDDLVMNYNIDTGVSELEHPTHYIEKDADEFHKWSSVRGINMMVSPEHRMIFRWNKKWAYKFIESREALNKHQESTTGFTGRFPTTFSMKEKEGLPIRDIDLRMAIAFQADGHQRKDLKAGNVTFMFKKQRKIDRMLSLIEEGGYKHSKPFVSSKGVWCIRVHIPYSPKVFDGFWWGVNQRQAEIIKDEVFYWDGHDRSYSTTSKQNADYIQYIFTVCGFRARVYRGQEKKGPNQKDVYQTRWSSKDSVSIANKDNKIEVEVVKPEDGDKKYCFTTTTGAWVARRNGCIFPTGNSSAINQIAFNTILLSRDKMSEDPHIKNSTLVQLVKCRRTGDVGKAAWLKFDPDTTHFYTSSDPYEKSSDNTLAEFEEEFDNEVERDVEANNEPVFNTPD